MPTRYASWTAFAEALGEQTRGEDEARAGLCRDACTSAPPWLIAHKPRDGPNMEYRLVSPLDDGSLAATPVLVSLYDITCEGAVEAEIPAVGDVRSVVLHVEEQDVAPDTTCPPTVEVCDDTCKTFHWECRLRVVAATLEVVIEACASPVGQ